MAADVFLSALQQKGAVMLLLIALMADLGNESLHLIREMDKETVETADIYNLVQSFLDGLVWLFRDGGVFKMQGHTAYALEWLSTPHLFPVAGGQFACLGGGSPTAYDEDKAIAMRELKACIVVIESVVRAEFPECDLMWAFSVFSIPKSVAQSRVAITQDMRSKLRALEHIFGVEDLVHQYERHLPYAAEAYRNSGYCCSYIDAWLTLIHI